MAHTDGRIRVVAALATLLLAMPCGAAVIVLGPPGSISIGASSGLTQGSDAYSEHTQYTSGPEPQTVSLSRSREVSSGGQVVARLASTATQTSTLVLEPLELRATVDAAFTAHVDRPASSTAPFPTGAGGVSDFNLILEITDAPAHYFFSGRVFDASQVRVVQSTPGGFEELHLLQGRPRDTSGVPFDFRGTIEPDRRYSFRVNASGTTLRDGEVPGVADMAGSVRGVSLRITQVPEPSAVFLAASLASLLLPRRPVGRY